MKKDKDYARVRFFDGDTVDESENVIYIEATKEDSYKYRNSLVDFGVDLETYAKGENGHCNNRKCRIYSNAGR